MTNPNYHQKRPAHNPLPLAVRSWESSSFTRYSPSEPSRGDLPRFTADDGDFAEEASYDTSRPRAVTGTPLGPLLDKTGPREDAPKLRSEGHFWGIAGDGFGKKGGPSRKG